VKRLSTESENVLNRDFEQIVSDLLASPVVQSMDGQIHHNSVTTLEHCLSVAFMSFKLSRRIGLDSRAVARGAMLHDLYLYDWHEIKPPEGLHGFTHPGIALRNASKLFELNELERDIICKHMWPLTIKPPTYKESLLVCLVDKYCALLEVVNHRRKQRLEKFKTAISLLDSSSQIQTES
jgi:uncharacterized protein